MTDPSQQSAEPNAIGSEIRAAFHGRYRLEREIGAGGMATVFLAHDLRHDRKVAIKVLHPELAAAIGAERFLAEIRVTANLQHPHILPLHDSGIATIGESAGASTSLLYYVMPYVQGESLRDRLARERQLPITDAVAITRDVAAALDYAHRQGVIHRDIKPENILLHEGRPLVADFGIALAVQSAGTSRMTHTGLSLGTPQYMSPEQAMGERNIDARSDVYALGAVLYEMLTGEPPFTGASVQAIIAKVMTERPVAPSTVRDTVPAHVEDAVLTALAKLPADRFASAGAFGAALAQPQHATLGRNRVPTERRGGWRVATVVSTVVAIVAIVALALTTRGASDDTRGRPVMRFDVELPDSLAVQKLVLTPDGTRLIISTLSQGPYVHTFADARLSRLEIPGGGAIRHVDVTPDGATLVFLERSSVKTMPIGGGPVRTIGDSMETVRVGDDGYVYGTSGLGLRRISLASGASERLHTRGGKALTADSLFGEIGVPVPIPGGRGVVFPVSIYAPPSGHLYVLDLRTGDTTRLPYPETDEALPMGFSPTGHLLVRQSDAIYALKFNAKTLRAEGAPELVVSGMPPLTVTCGGGSPCSSEAFNGRTIAFVRKPPTTAILVDRRGGRRPLPNIPANLEFYSTSASPDGRMVLYQAADHASHRLDIWTYRMPDGPLTRLTSGRGAFFWAPGWGADGKTIRYDGVSEHGDTVFQVPRDGSRPAEPFESWGDGFGYSIVYHPDGRRLASVACVEAQKGAACRNRGLVVLTAGGSMTPVKIADIRTRPLAGGFSPDGRWLAYSAREVSREEVYVAAIDGSGARWQVSRNGGSRARWSHDGRTVFFVANDSLFAADWNPTAEQHSTTVRALFRLGAIGGWYDALPGDSTFVMLGPGDTARTRAVVIANFVEQLRDRRIK